MVGKLGKGKGTYLVAAVFERRLMVGLLKARICAETGSTRHVRNFPHLWLQSGILPFYKLTFILPTNLATPIFRQHSEFLPEAMPCHASLLATLVALVTGR